MCLLSLALICCYPFVVIYRFWVPVPMRSNPVNQNSIQSSKHIKEMAYAYVITNNDVIGIEAMLARGRGLWPKYVTPVELVIGFGTNPFSADIK